jgi:predicted transcriptional regulator
VPNERVRHIMTPTAISIGVHEPITEALRLFAKHPIHHLPVVEAGELRGILSSADILKLEHFLPKSGPPGSAASLNERFRVELLMRRPVITAKPDDTIADAAAQMAGRGFHSLPVVGDTNDLLGIITTTDVMQALLHGMGIHSAPAQSDSNRSPSEPEIRRALEAATSAVQAGADANGVCACLLSLHERNAKLEHLLTNLALYLHSGQDGRTHARLLKEVAQLGAQTDFLVPL